MSVRPFRSAPARLTPEERQAFKQAMVRWVVETVRKERVDLAREPKIKKRLRKAG